MELTEMFGHAVKHAAIHALWMVPMAAVMMPSPTLLGSLVGSADMLVTNSFNFFADGQFSTLIENTMNGEFWGEGYSLGDGSMDMSKHAGHLPAAPSDPVLSDSAKALLGMK